MEKINDYNVEDIKFKHLDLDRLIISFDRLTRFKDYETKYTRVFKDILSEALVNPRLKKSQMDRLNYATLTNIAELIINSSLNILGENSANYDYSVNYRLKNYELNLFDCGKEAEVLLDNKLNYRAFIDIIDTKQDMAKNLMWLKLLDKSNYTPEVSYSSGYRFPIKKLVICEGITEEILLPVFADLLGYNFDNNGVQIISAGGKNQVVKLFYKYSEQLKIPIFVLLDSDAEQNSKEIEPKLRKYDKIYRIECGEFEDILPVTLIEKSLRYSIANISDTPEEAYDFSEGTVHYLEEFYKNRGAHEFKKAEFAHIVNNNISDISDISDECRKIISGIMSM